MATPVYCRACGSVHDPLGACRNTAAQAALLIAAGVENAKPQKGIESKAEPEPIKVPEEEVWKRRAVNAEAALAEIRRKGRERVARARKKAKPD